MAAAAGGPGGPVRVLVAVGGPWEAPLVAGLAGAADEVQVVRRCADLPELLAAASAGLARAAVVSDDLRHLDRDAVDRLRSAGVAVVGLAGPGSPGAAERLDALGVSRVLPADTPGEDVAAALVAAVATAARPPAGATAAVARPPSAHGPDLPADRVIADPAAALRALEADLAAPPRPTVAAEVPDVPPAARPRGRVVVVWGPPGAPGRTTVATSLAAELALLERRPGAAARDVLLVDADVHAASAAQVLGLLDDAPGLASAVRAAAQGRLDLVTLARTAPVVGPGLRVLTGLPRADRWPEIRPSGLELVLERARELAAWTVVDVAAPIEQDEELSFDTAAPRRNGATLLALEAADVVLAVGTADPVGLARLVRALQDLREAVPGASARVVVTRVRASAVGRQPEQRVVDALARYAAVVDPVLVPEDRESLDGALLAGRVLAEHAPGSAARRALQALAVELAGDPAEAGQQRPARARGRRVARLARS